jgi:hypothetical protein
MTNAKPDDVSGVTWEPVEHSRIEQMVLDSLGHLHFDNISGVSAGSLRVLGRLGLSPRPNALHSELPRTSLLLRSVGL